MNRDAFAEMPQVMSTGVLAVVVIYERGLDRVAPWPALCAAMKAPRTEGGLALERVLVYDNSAAPKVSASQIPAWAIYAHDPANGGTAAAYGRALQEAQRLGLPWLLLLDDDTCLPADLLLRAAAALRCAQPSPAAVLPRVQHDNQSVSPSHITWSGSICPLLPDESPQAGRPLTGIASGALVHVASCRALGPLPRGLWLDYVDHWMFTSLQRSGHAVVVSDARLDHDLSVSEPRRIGAARLTSVLQGEKIFARTLAWPARLMRPLRLLWRALRVSPLSPAQRVHIVGHLLGGGSGGRG